MFVPTVPAGVGFDSLLGSMEKVAQVDIVVGEDGTVIKDRHGDANKVLANLAADTRRIGAKARLKDGDPGLRAWPSPALGPEGRGVLMAEPRIAGRVRAELVIEDEFDLAEVTKGWSPRDCQRLRDREPEALEALNSVLRALLRGRTTGELMVIHLADDGQGEPS